MKKVVLIIMFLLMVISSGIHSANQNIYVNNVIGNDSWQAYCNNPDSPLKSIRKAVEYANAISASAIDTIFVVNTNIPYDEDVEDFYNKGQILITRNYLKITGINGRPEIINNSSNAAINCFYTSTRNYIEIDNLSFENFQYAIYFYTNSNASYNSYNKVDNCKFKLCVIGVYQYFTGNTSGAISYNQQYWFTFNEFYYCNHSYYSYAINSYVTSGSSPTIYIYTRFKNNTFISSSVSIYATTNTNYTIRRYIYAYTMNNNWINSSLNTYYTSYGYLRIYHDNFWNSTISSSISKTIDVRYYVNPYLLAVNGETTAYLTKSENSDLLLTGGYEQDLIGARGIGESVLDSFNDVYCETGAGIGYTGIGTIHDSYTQPIYYYNDGYGMQGLKTNFDTALIRMKKEFGNIINISGFSFNQLPIANFIDGFNQVINYYDNLKAPYFMRYKIKYANNSWSDWQMVNMEHRFNDITYIRGIEFECVLRTKL